MTNRPLVTVILTGQSSLTPEDIWSILEKQQGTAFDLKVVSAGPHEKIPAKMLEKAGDPIELREGQGLGTCLNAIAEENENDRLIFLRDRVQPTHDHYIKRMVSAFGSQNQAVFGKEVTTPQANYILADEISRRFPSDTTPGRGNITIDHFAIRRRKLLDRAFSNRAHDPALHWAVNSEDVIGYAPEAIVMRDTMLPLAALKRQAEERGHDLALAGKPPHGPAMMSVALTLTLRDILLSIKLLKPQHIWFPPLYRFGVARALVRGGKKAYRRGKKK